MGYKAMEWVVRNCQQTGSKKLAMMILAFHSDDKGECFPSLETLSNEVVVNERQMRAILRELETSGEIETKTGGGRRTNTYRILGYIRDSKSDLTASEGQRITPVENCPSSHTYTENNLSGGASTTPVISRPSNGDIQKTTSLGGHLQPLSGAENNLSGGLLATPELKYNINSSTIEETKPIKNNVAPVGDDTQQTYLPESTHPPQLTQSGNANMSQSSDQTGTTYQPATPVIVAVEGMPTNSDTTKPNSKPSSKPTPPVVPPADSPKVRTLSDHQLMVSAIAKAFGWDFAIMTKSNKKLVGKVASELREAGATADDIPALYAYCKNQNWGGKWTPMALSSQWANFVADKATSSASVYQTENGMIFPVYVPPADYKPLFDYSALTVAIAESPPQSDVNANITPAETVEGIKALISEFAKRMDIPVMDLDPNDPMNEVLPW